MTSEQFDKLIRSKKGRKIILNTLTPEENTKHCTLRDASYPRDKGKPFRLNGEQAQQFNDMQDDMTEQGE
jgi:hypothetical protein